MELVMLVFVVLIILVLVLSLILMYKSVQVKFYKKISKEVNSLEILKSMFALIGANISATEKLGELNNILKDKCKAEYSTIVWYDGRSNVIKASNVEENYAVALGGVAFEKDFANNIKHNVVKYKTTSSTAKTLSYNTAKDRKIRSSLFIPIIENNLYLGFVIIESAVPKAFEKVTKAELTLIKESLAVFLPSVLSQEKIERVEDTDKQTGLYNSFYLFSKGQYVIENVDNTAFIMISFPELKKVNEYYGRKIGDKYLISAIEYIRNSVSNKAVIVRYATAKILVLAPDTTVENVLRGITTLQNSMKVNGVMLPNGKVEINTRFALTNYTKHSDMDKTLQRLENKVDEVNSKEIIAIIK